MGVEEISTGAKQTLGGLIHWLTMIQGYTEHHSEADPEIEILDEYDPNVKFEFSYAEVTTTYDIVRGELKTLEQCTKHKVRIVLKAKDN